MRSACGGGGGGGRGEVTKGRLRSMRKRIRRGKGASLNSCSSTRATSAVYSSSSSATTATRIIVTEEASFFSEENEEPSCAHNKVGRFGLDSELGCGLDLHRRSGDAEAFYGV